MNLEDTFALRGLVFEAVRHRAIACTFVAEFDAATVTVQTDPVADTVDASVVWSGASAPHDRATSMPLPEPGDERERMICADHIFAWIVGRLTDGAEAGE